VSDPRFGRGENGCSQPNPGSVAFRRMDSCGGGPVGSRLPAGEMEPVQPGAPRASRVACGAGRGAARWACGWSDFIGAALFHFSRNPDPVGGNPVQLRLGGRARFANCLGGRIWGLAGRPASGMAAAATADSRTSGARRSGNRGCGRGNRAIASHQTPDPGARDRFGGHCGVGRLLAAPSFRSPAHGGGPCPRRVASRHSP